MANKILYGCEQIHIAFRNTLDTDWETPIPIPGVVGFNANPDGAENIFYADNIKYYVVSANNGYTGDLEMAVIHDDVLIKMLGWHKDDNDMIIEDIEGVPTPFALMGQVQGDSKNRKFIYYNCIASRPARVATTKTDTITPQTQTLSITALPIEVTFGGNTIKTPKGEIELTNENKSVYDDFFDIVTLPDASLSLVELNGLIVLATELKDGDFEDTEDLETALTAAGIVVNLDTPTQKQVNEALANLKYAILTLVPSE